MSVKVKKKIVFLAVLVALFSIAPSLAVNTTVNAANKKTVKKVALKIGKKAVTKKTYSLKKGAKATIKVSVSPKTAKKTVSFKSSDKKIATVSKKGVVTAKKKGTAKITVTVKGKDKKTKKTWIKIKVTDKTKGSSSTSSNKTPPADTKPSTGTNPANDNQPTETYPGGSTEAYIVDAGNGGNKVYCKIYTPEKEGKYPAIIMCHGLNGTHNDFTNECKYFAENGYVACAIDFCGGSPVSKSTGKVTDMTIFTEKSNLLATYNYIKDRNYVNSDEIFLFGGSQGGLVTALATEEVAEGVKGMILYFPAFNIPDDWRVMYPHPETLPDSFEFWYVTFGREFAVSIHDFYPFDHIGGYQKNVLILYGEQDTIVRRNYIDRAVSTYKNASLITYPNDGHGFTPATAIKAQEEVLKFMNAQ